MKYDRIASDEWITPVMDDWRLACCDCGLVHRVDFRVEGEDVQIRFRRDNRATGQRRRWMKEAMP